ncbi:MAG: glucitol/sorbitol system component [Rubrobacteraceae bacterium]|nr:glucitol/sorbitol system component [Rubrobacteraceae bacterium]
MESIYLTEIKEVGPEVEEFLEMGLLVLFEVGAPPELAEMSALHEPSHRREDPPEAGDVLAIGEREFRITAVGEKAWKNIEDLGHAVFMFNGATEVELPGQIYLEEQGVEDLGEVVRPGVRLEIKADAGTAATVDRKESARES